MAIATAELATRFPENPLLSPRNVRPTRPDFVVQCLLNPGALKYKGRFGLLLRVAERPRQEEGWITTVIRNPACSEGTEILRFRLSDPEVDVSDPRILSHKGKSYLTTLSHLRLAWSDDGVHFTVDERPALEGDGPQETYGMEDCRVTQIGSLYCLTYSAAFAHGYGVGLVTTRDWATYDRHGMIFPTPNKDCTLFPEMIGEIYWALHRPSSTTLGGSDIWIARSPDLVHWGRHECVVRTREGLWDNARVGAGAAPIRTDSGWLVIYHGANNQHRYCLGAFLLDLNDPARVLARSLNPIMEPLAEYERCGFFGNVVFTNGHIVEGDRVKVYYGASDEVVCGAEFSLSELVDSMEPLPV